MSPVVCAVGSTSLSVRQPRMHHAPGRLPDQHHGLWGVCSPHPSTALLSSWIHLQLRNRCSEVQTDSSYPQISSLNFRRTLTSERKGRKWQTCFVSTSSITYNGSMESPVPLYPTDCPPPYEAVMGQRAASQVSIQMFQPQLVSFLTGKTWLKHDLNLKVPHLEVLYFKWLLLSVTIRLEQSQ